jgi:hypothetical protein
MPDLRHEPGQAKGTRPARFLLLGAAGTLVFFLLSWVIPTTGFPPFLNILALLMWVVFVGILILRFTDHARAWTDKHLVALIGGGLSFFVALDFLTEFIPSSAKDYTGQAFVGIGFVGFLAWLYRRTAGTESFSAIAQTNPSFGHLPNGD